MDIDSILADVLVHIPNTDGEVRRFHFLFEVPIDCVPLQASKFRGLLETVRAVFAPTLTTDFTRISVSFRRD